MTVEAELFDGTILEFPDGTSQSVIAAKVKELTAARQTGGSVGPQSEDVTTGVGRGIQDALMALGIGPDISAGAAAVGELPPAGPALRAEHPGYCPGVGTPWPGQAGSGQ